MKKNIALLTGGNHGEYEISIQSAELMDSLLDKDIFDIYKIFIKGMDWYYICSNGERIQIDKNDFSITIEGSKIIFDAVFMSIHGDPGENGKLEGYFDMLNIPYTTCNMTTSAITFNKGFTTKIVSTSGVKVCNSIVIYKDDVYDIDEISTKLNFPLFVKPNNGGSSVATSKVIVKEQLDDAIKTAFSEDDEVIIEEFFKGRELTCGVYKNGGVIKTLPVTEIISKSESGWFDLKAKYQGFSEEVVPANIPELTSMECKNMSAMLYRYLNCNGIVRFDYIWNGLEFRFLEANTVPGMTKESIIPKMVKAAGLTTKQFYNDLILEALNNHTK